MKNQLPSGDALYTLNCNDMLIVPCSVSVWTPHVITSTPIDESFTRQHQNKREGKTMRFHISATFYGSDRLELRAQRQSPQEQIQLEPLPLQPVRAKCRARHTWCWRDALHDWHWRHVPSARWLAMRVTERLLSFHFVLLSTATPWSQLEQAQHTPQSWSIAFKEGNTNERRVILVLGIQSHLFELHPSCQAWAWS